MSNLDNHIGIDIIHGNAEVSEDDKDRARRAAEAHFEHSGVSVSAARAAYVAQWMEFDDEAPMHEDALHWMAANEAANNALTQGWDKPCAAWCAIR